MSEHKKRGPHGPHKPKFVYVTIAELLTMFRPEAKIPVSTSIFPLLTSNKIEPKNGIDNLKVSELTSDYNEPSLEFTITKPND